MTCVIGLDIGTTSTIGILIRLPDQVLALEWRPVDLYSERQGWAEEDPQQWWSNVGEITRALITKAGIAAERVAAIGVAGMLPAVVLLDDEDRLLRWSIQQSDGRCAVEVEELRAEVDEADFVRIAGNGVNQQLVACKLRWIEKHEPEVFAKIATVFGSYDYINFRLTGERRIEQNWALEGGFVDLRSQSLSPELFALTHLPASALPAKAASHEVIGRVHAQAAGETGLPVGLPVVGGAADFIASALASGLVRPGDALLKFGGSVDILGISERPAPDPRLFLDYHLAPRLYVPNGCMSTGGSALNWFARRFAGGEREAARAEGVTIHQRLDRLAETTPARADGVSILPYFLGEKTPIHDPFARGAILGLSLNHGLPHLWRALLESYAYAIAHHVEVFADMGVALTRFSVSDGGANSRFWMQIVADVLQQPLQLPVGHPGSCLGAAWTAAIGVGAASDWAGVAKFVGDGGVLQPNPAHAATYAEGYQLFRQAYPRLKGLSEGATS
ncbi:MAG: FGGY-family carbohydrate kinase [Pseudomonadota bacterium]|nr:FGGY-family carbohydrate kinase [Pseudomonadota bacterium]